jgi:nucleoside phosphorylase
MKSMIAKVLVMAAAGLGGAAQSIAVPPLELRSIADIPLGGHPTRLDYWRRTRMWSRFIQ